MRRRALAAAQAARLQVVIARPQRPQVNEAAVGTWRARVHKTGVEAAEFDATRVSRCMASVRGRPFICVCDALWSGNLLGRLSDMAGNVSWSYMVTKRLQFMQSAAIDASSDVQPARLCHDIITFFGAAR